MRVFVSSTCIDYELRRMSIHTLITNMGHTPIMTDAPNFVTIPNIHSHDVCLRSINDADIFFLIIQPNYGQLYEGTLFPKYKGLSITHAELKRAEELKKTIIVYGQDTVYNERYIFKHSPKAKITSDPRTFNIWSEVTRGKKNNWIIQFNTDTDLMQKIKNELNRLQNFNGQFW